MIVYFKALRAMLFKFVYYIFGIISINVFFVCLSVSPCLTPPSQLPTPQRKQRPVCNCVFALLRPTIHLHWLSTVADAEISTK